MSNILTRQVARLGREEDGQMAIAVVLALPVIFMFIALGMDTGLWYTDHRLAQNQVDAAVLAAAQFLPAAETDPEYQEARDTVDLWLAKNGSGHEELCEPDENGPYPQFFDLHPAASPDGRLDMVRVCVRRQSPGVFAAFAGIPFVWVSAVAAARVAPSSLANVKPWAIAPDDPYCLNPGQLCVNDDDEDGNMTPCGFYPPVPLAGSLENPDGLGLCPWGLHEDRLHRFKVSSGGIYTPGNFAPITACGDPGAAEYERCINGDSSSGFYKVDDSVWIDIQTGNMVGPSISGVDELFSYEETVSPSLLVDGGKYEETLICDVLSMPDPDTGRDPRGKDRADATYVAGRGFTDTDINSPFYGETFDYNPIDRCNRRLVSIVVIDQFPSGSGTAVVLGVATYSIARWDRTPAYNDAMGNSANGEVCGQTDPKDGVGYACGQIWGYFMQDASPPDVLLQISDTDNPFAPVFIAMVE